MPGRKYKINLLVVFFVLFSFSCINPVYPTEMFLQHSITLVMFACLIIVIIKNSLSDRSFTIIVLFLLLHLIGARWIYSNVPYKEWFSFIMGELFPALNSSGRNHYDRFVHLMFGLMLFYPIREACEKWAGCPSRLSGIFAFLIITCCSLFYEVFEWGLTLVLSPQDAEDYNGQQGDMWDAQKDMALAFTGAIINLLANVLKRKLRMT
ncbi:MAG: DUF2238 domain-containing protein [Bacteroidales bacterium]|nr:DUF2238 domain-containing protein [Bacteroidales bacterium]